MGILWDGTAPETLDSDREALRKKVAQALKEGRISQEQSEGLLARIDRQYELDRMEGKEQMGEVAFRKTDNHLADAERRNHERGEGHLR